MNEATTRNPKVWIGCLAAYNCGRLHGEWVDVPETADELWGEIKRVLAKSPVPGAEEWFFGDYEDFRPWQPGEYPDVEKLVLAAELIREKGDAAAYYLNVKDDPFYGVDDYDDLEAAFSDSYRGEWDSPRDYAYNWVSELGIPGVGYVFKQAAGSFGIEKYETWDETYGLLDSYLDWDLIAREIIDHGTVTESGGHYFETDV
jgi:antirestriction protein